MTWLVGGAVTRNGQVPYQGAVIKNQKVYLSCESHLWLSPHWDPQPRAPVPVRGFSITSGDENQYGLHLSKTGSCCSSSGARPWSHTLALGSRSEVEVWKGTGTKGRIKLTSFMAKAGRGSAQGRLLWAQKCRQVLLFLCWVFSAPRPPGAGSVKSG